MLSAVLELTLQTIPVFCVAALPQAHGSGQFSNGRARWME